MKLSENAKVSFLARMSINDQKSIIRNNIHTIAKELKTEDEKVLSNGLYELRVISQVDCDIVSVILDVIDFRYSDCIVNGFTGDEMDFILNFLCIS